MRRLVACRAFNPPELFEMKNLAVILRISECVQQSSVVVGFLQCFLMRSGQTLSLSADTRRLSARLPGRVSSNVLCNIWRPSEGSFAIMVWLMSLMKVRARRT